jgi:hypothetical protein
MSRWTRVARITSGRFVGGIGWGVVIKVGRDRIRGVCWVLLICEDW